MDGTTQPMLLLDEQFYLQTLMYIWIEELPSDLNNVFKFDLVQ